MIMNIENLDWDPLLLKFFEVPKSVLPEIKSSSEVYIQLLLFQNVWMLCYVCKWIALI